MHCIDIYLSYFSFIVLQYSLHPRLHLHQKLHWNVINEKSWNIITVFSICSGKHCLRSSGNRPYKVGEMTAGVIPATDWKKLLYLLPGYVKNLPKRTELLEFLRDTNREELKKTRHFAIALLQWFSLLAFACLQSSHLSRRQAIPENISPWSRTSKSIKMQPYLCLYFVKFLMATGQ